MATWRSALELLPPRSRQHKVISKKLAELGNRVNSVRRAEADRLQAEEGELGRRGAGTAGLGTIGLLLWKFKFLAVVIATKGKLLLLGLTKGSTLLSMFVTVGAYMVALGLAFRGNGGHDLHP